MLGFTPSSRQKKTGEYTMKEIAYLLGGNTLNVNTLVSAISRTEREIERTPDNRGRPRSLDSAQVRSADRQVERRGEGKEGTYLNSALKSSEFVRTDSGHVSPDRNVAVFVQSFSSH